MRQLFFLFFILFITACSYKPAPSVIVEKPLQNVNFTDDVKPILDQKCVSCHSCYNSPCQAKFSSFEGIDRGGSKIVVYDALRLKAIEPTRLFIDAKSTQEWREKGFFSLTQNTETNASRNNSIMLQMLYEKKMHPEIVGSYRPEKDELICPKDQKEMSKYVHKKPHHGMPYGFPAITEKEYRTLASWLQNGAHGIDAKALQAPSATAAKEIRKWENFLNKEDAKHSVTARYLYEHLYLAHWHFQGSADDEFYQIVRSYTAAPKKIDIIATRRPFDDPKVQKFYYRLERVKSTLVDKTHMVIDFDAKKFDYIHKLFIESRWPQKPHKITYDPKLNANPFLAFAQIPTQSRYKFLLDNSEYIIMTFIKGPVCRGQMALNVIHDHFWVLFSDPQYDIAVKRPDFLLTQSENLSLPIESTSQNILETFSDAYRDRYHRYYGAKQELLYELYPQGEGLEHIWSGYKAADAPVLTIYRHFDSASVHRGLLGKMPRTLWVIDYSQLERIYYTLVAGYDVFGNVAHQTNIRRYMDFLRIEGELHFLAYMPKNIRLDMLESWYIGTDIIQELQEKDTQMQLATSYYYANRETAINYTTPYLKAEFMQQVVQKRLLDACKIDFDRLNYLAANEKAPKMPQSLQTPQDFQQAVLSMTASGTQFIRHFTDEEINTVMIKVVFDDNTTKVFTFVINRWHDNVNSMFSEEKTLNPDKDTIDIIEGYVGSYPNAFALIKQKDLADFFDLVNNYEDTPQYNAKIDKYFIHRSNKDFWKIFKWFNEDYKKKNPIKAGLFDLNRYYPN